MKRFWKITVAAVLVLTLSAPAAFAWEFDLTGKFLYGWDYFSAGKEGFFGPNNVVSPSGLIPTSQFGTFPNPNWAGMNGWVGARTINNRQYGLVVGTDAALNWSRMEFWPEIRLNQAIRLRGQYSIGGLPTTPNVYSLHTNSDSFGSYSGMTFGQWDQWWITAQLPIGILVFGKRPAPFGIGTQYEGTMASSEALAIVAPYGPLRIGAFVYPWRRASWIAPTLNEAALIRSNSRTNISGTAGASPNAGVAATLDWDKENIRNIQPGIFFTYSSGDVEFGALYEWWSQHSSPAEATSMAVMPVLATYDQIAEDGAIFFKYFNGRFFFNSEVSWFRGQVNYTPPLTPGASVAIQGTPVFDLTGNPPPAGISGRLGATIAGTSYFQAPPLDPLDGLGSEYAPSYTEGWKLGVETGVIAGPAKVSLLYSWVSGPDRRNGVWIKHQSWENVAGGRFLGNAQFFLPYSLLMAYQYGGGLNAVNQRGEGFMTDASSWGARVDYSVAANLNVYGTFFYANRVSHGWGWGSIVPNANRSAHLLGSWGSGLERRGTTPTAWFINRTQFQPTASPSIPDDALGWEVSVGADWKLLEGITLQMRGAYWNVGNWFKYACVDKALVTFNGDNAATATPLITDGSNLGLSWGVNPDRALDQIVGFQAAVVVDF